MNVNKTLILNTLMQYKKFASKAEFARFLEITPQNLSQWLKRNTFDISIVGNKFPEVNHIWLLTGEGEMLKESAEKQLRTQETLGTPVYNIDVVCGTEGRDLYFADERIIGYVDLPGISRSSHIIEASGDSMSPRINNGDRIVVREIETWDYFVYGQAYVIITDEYRLLKYVRKHPERPNEYVLLRSENLAYDDIELPITAIRKLFVVENVLSVKNVL